MLNTINTIKADGTFHNVAKLIPNKSYKLTFKLDTLSNWPRIHLHRIDGSCLSIIPVAGNSILPNRKYSYVINNILEGYLALKPEINTSMYDIVVEEIEE